MKLRILGSGTSTGVPEIGCTCEVCTSTDVRNRRLRTSALLHIDDESGILIDCGPDFREQMLRSAWFGKIEGVLLTHEHYDHVGGLDDLRPYCRKGEIPLYADAYTSHHLRERMPYCLGEVRYPGSPLITLRETAPLKPFFIRDIQITPFAVLHGKLPILGFRIGEKLGYITDMLTMPDESYEQLHGLDVLVVNALRHKPHPAHQTIEAAIETARRINARETYFVHMCHGAGLHAELEQQLPPHIHLTYDGMVIY
ncbi:MAG: MBL fold metallo-hydrolase [Mediterranea sp.]|jgi:phosphoribosyl 1,2-cyclic phosphate phosphodiesterase|nr:MBL fold metallo-hydrolase [Mediterranea sp.]